MQKYHLVYHPLDDSPKIACRLEQGWGGKICPRRWKVCPGSLLRPKYCNLVHFLRPFSFLAQFKQNFGPVFPRFLCRAILSSENFSTPPLQSHRIRRTHRYLCLLLCSLALNMLRTHFSSFLSADLLFLVSTTLSPSAGLYNE